MTAAKKFDGRRTRECITRCGRKGIEGIRERWDRGAGFELHADGTACFGCIRCESGCHRRDEVCLLLLLARTQDAGLSLGILLPYG